MDVGRMRIAVAEEMQANLPADRLGRALRFALFDVSGLEVRGPFYRVRHDDPGGNCDAHAELTDLLHDCRVVISGGAGQRLRERLRGRGIETVVTPERRPAAALVTRYLSDILETDSEAIDLATTP